MFEIDEEDGSLNAVHHPFTAPSDDDSPGAPGQSWRCAFRVVTTWCSMVRRLEAVQFVFTARKCKKAVFQLLDINEERAKDKFGFLLDALTYGCPPHGGIAFGLDRIAALMANEDSIRDVIAFPKTTQAQCLMTGAPSEISDDQLKELHIKPAD